MIVFLGVEEGEFVLPVKVSKSKMTTVRVACEQALLAMGEPMLYCCRYYISVYDYMDFNEIGIINYVHTMFGGEGRGGSLMAGSSLGCGDHCEK